jgi:hypothetical protein
MNEMNNVDNEFLQQMNEVREQKKKLEAKADRIYDDVQHFRDRIYELYMGVKHKGALEKYSNLFDQTYESLFGILGKFARFWDSPDRDYKSFHIVDEFLDKIIKKLQAFDVKYFRGEKGKPPKLHNIFNFLSGKPNSGSRSYSSLNSSSNSNAKVPAPKKTFTRRGTKMTEAERKAKYEAERKAKYEAERKAKEEREAEEKRIAHEAQIKKQIEEAAALLEERKKLAGDPFKQAMDKLSAKYGSEAAFAEYVKKDEPSKPHKAIKKAEKGDTNEEKTRIIYEYLEEKYKSYIEKVFSKKGPKKGGACRRTQRRTQRK